MKGLVGLGLGNTNQQIRLSHMDVIKSGPISC